MHHTGGGGGTIGSSAMDVTARNEWFNKASLISKLSMDAPIDVAAIRSFQIHLNNNLPLNHMSVSDMSSLIQSEVIHDNVMLYFCRLLNQSFYSTGAFCFYFNYFSPAGQIYQEIVQRMAYMKRLIMFLNVCKDEQNIVHISGYFEHPEVFYHGSHYSLAVFDLESQTLTYADTLGWKAPQKFHDFFQYIHPLTSPSVSYSVIYCHTPQDVAAHTCGSQCSPIYPLQTCSNACGVAVIIGMVLAALRPILFLSLVLGLASDGISYVKDITSYSTFLRFILISWISSGNIAPDNLACASPGLMREQPMLAVPASDPASSFATRETPPLNLKFSKKCESNERQEIQRQEVQKQVNEVHKKQEEMQQLQGEVQQMQMNMHQPGKEVQQMQGEGQQQMQDVQEKQKVHHQPCEQMAPTDNYANTCSAPSKGVKALKPVSGSTSKLKKERVTNSQVLDLPDKLYDFLVKFPDLTFLRNRQCLRLRMHTISGDILTKSFTCSYRGLNDKKAIGKINKYLSSSKCYIDLETKATGSGQPAIAVPDHLKGFISTKLSYLKTGSLRLTVKSKSQKTVSRQVTCTSLGREDTKAMKKLQNWLDTSEELKKWVIKQDSEQGDNVAKNSKPKFQIPERVQVFLGKCQPWLSVQKNGVVKLHILLINGSEVTKSFPPNTPVADIQTYIDGEDLLNRLTGQRVTDEELGGDWKKIGYVGVGVPTSQYIEQLGFDVCREFWLAPGIQRIYPNYARNVPVTSHPRWGKTHHFDETFAFIGDGESPSPSGRAVELYLTCASKSRTCQSVCHAKLSDIDFKNMERNCSACGEELEFPNKTCFNCGCNYSPAWRKHGDEDMCLNCYAFKRKHAAHRRPPTQHKQCNFRSHKHFRCPWKLKFIIYFSDLSHWVIYEQKSNSLVHSVSSFTMQWQPQTTNSNQWNDSSELPCEPRRQLVTSPEYYDKPPSYVLPKGDSLTPSYMLPEPPSRVEAVERQVMMPVNDACDSIMDISNCVPNPSKAPKQSLVCLKCIKESRPNIFHCSSKRELNRHLKTHDEETFACAQCLSAHGGVVTFKTDKEFRSHLKKVHHIG